MATPRRRWVANTVGLALLAGVCLSAQAQTSMTTIAGHSYGGTYIGNEGSYASPSPQSFDFPGSRPFLPCYCTADDRFVGYAGWGAVGFSYDLTAANAPGNNYAAGAFYRGGFRDYFTLSGPALGTWAELQVHVTLRASIQVALNSVGGQPYVGSATYDGLRFSNTTISAEADGHTLMVSPEHPVDSLDYTVSAVVGYANSGSLSGGLGGQVQPGVGMDYTVAKVLGVSAAWDLLPAHGNGLLYSVTTAPGVSVTFASGHVYAPVPEPGSIWLMGLGLAAMALLQVHRRIVS
jgi:hypothetical protein